MLRRQDNEIKRAEMLHSLQSSSMQIAQFSRQLFGDIENMDYSTFSPLVPYSLYQAAVVQYRWWKQTDEEIHKMALESLKEVLGSFNRRWLIAGD
jgi:hypothetical protein